MVQIEEIPDGPEPSEFKDQANDAFKIGNYDEAMHLYRLGLQRIKQLLPSYPVSESHYDLIALRQTITLNMAMVELKRGRYEACIIFCNVVCTIITYSSCLPIQRTNGAYGHKCMQVLASEEGNVKALYRKADALRRLGGRDDEAIETLCTLLDNEPDNPAALQLLKVDLII
jgi:tetratricopeptide (TPR) repeat protein